MTKFMFGILIRLFIGVCRSGFPKKLTLRVSSSFVAALMVPIMAHAQASGAAATSGASSTTVTGATGNGLATSGTSISSALTNGASQWQSITSSILTTATTGANTLSTESDKLAYALAVITVVIAAVEFAGTHHPTSAWIQLFKTVGGLGFFAGAYTSYSTAGPGIYNWFNTLAGDIQSSQNTSTMYTAGDTILNGILHSFDTVSISLTSIPLDQIFQIFYTDFIAFVVLIIVIVTGIVYMYYSYAGLVQAGIGIIFGKIGIALGFSSFTRSYFTSWLGYMVHAGMYTAVAAAMNYLVIGTVVQKISAVAGSGGGTGGAIVTIQSAIQMEVLAIFMLFLSFEIPKIAGMFGSGSVGGSTMLNAGLSAAKAVTNSGKKSSD
jgi:hypothetical protein